MKQTLTIGQKNYRFGYPRVWLRVSGLLGFGKILKFRVSGWVGFWIFFRVFGFSGTRLSPIVYAASFWPPYSAKKCEPQILKPRCAVWTLSRMAEFVYIVPRRYISKIFKMAAAYSCWPRCMRPLAIFWVKHFVDLGRPKQKSKQNSDGPSGL